MATCGAANGHGLEPRGFHHHVCGLRRNHRVPAAHHAGEAQRFGVIRHNQVFGVKHALHAVQRFQPLAFACAANNDAAFDFVQIEGVRRLAHRQPCKVCSVHGVRDALLFEQSKVCGDLRTFEPIARVADGDAAQDARCEAAALILSLNGDRKRRC